MQLAKEHLERFMFENGIPFEGVGIGFTTPPTVVGLIVNIREDLPLSQDLLLKRWSLANDVNIKLRKIPDSRELVTL